MNDHRKFRLHVVALPHTQTTIEYESCAYTGKVRKFCDMMSSLGHEVYLYASEEADCKVTELITCITKQEIQDTVGVFGPEDILKAPFDSSAAHWQIMNSRAIAEIKARIQPKDIICLISGLTQKSIADYFPEGGPNSPANQSVEFGIGYSGTYCKYKVFESFAWMHMIYGWKNGSPSNSQGAFYDRVIPNYYEKDAFPLGEDKGYLLFVGRNNEDKGINIAIQTAEQLKMPLKVAGQPYFPLPDWVDYRGLVGPEERGELMSNATALFCPTLYIEPFGGVHVEAMLCGTPVITTDWGVFSETVEHGKTGFRCRTFQDFVDAVKAVLELDRAYIQTRAQGKWSTDSVRWQYQDYFEDLYDLWEAGWYTGRSLVQEPSRPDVRGDPMALEGML